MAKPRAPLTALQIKSADAARANARLVDVTKGLTFIVGARGGTWQWQGRVGGTPRKIAGGRYEGGLGVTLAKARAWADEINGKLAKGVDVYVEFGNGIDTQQLPVEAPRKIMSCQEAWDIYMVSIKGENAATTIADKGHVWRRIFATTIGPKLLTEVTYLELADLVAPLRDMGKVAAFNNTVRYIKRFFTWAEEAEAKTGLTNSPARRLRADKSAKRDRYLNEMEVRWLWDAAGELDATSRAFFLTLLLTGQRRDELRDVVREELDLSREWMDLPAERMKGKLAHITPFGDKAWSLISNRISSHNYNVVFPSLRAHFDEAAYTVYDLCNALNFLNATMAAKAAAAGRRFERWTAHDLRRTFSTLASGILDDEEDTVLAADHIERVLAHKIAGVRGVYNKHEYLKEKRRVLRVWENEVRRIVGAEAFDRY